MRARVLPPIVCVLALVGTFAYSVGTSVGSSRAFADRVSSALEQPAVQRGVAAEATRQLVARAPDLVAARPLVETLVRAVVGASPFRTLARGTAYDIHRSLVDRNQRTVALTLVDASLLITDGLEAVSPTLAHDVPEGLPLELTRLSTAGDAGWVRRVLQLSSDLRLGGLAALGLALVLAVAALTGLRRRQTIARLGAGAAVAGATGYIALRMAELLIRAGTANRTEGDAVAAALRVVTGGLRTGCLVAIVAGVVIAAAARSLLPSLDVGELPERLWAMAVRPPRRTGLRVVRALALVVTGGAVVAAPTIAARIFAAAAGVVLLYLGTTELLRLLAGPHHDPERARPHVRMLVPAGAVAAAAVLVAGGVVALQARADAPEAPTATCNGSAALCDRPIADVVFPGTHNSMSTATGPGWLFAQQDDGIGAQLDHGIRALLVDTHFGVRTPRGVATDLEQDSKSRAKIQDELGAAFVARAERLRARIGFTGGGDEQVYLCHGYCETGATTAQEGFGELADFLTRHPGQVVILSIEDDTPPGPTIAAMREAGLLPEVWRGALDGERPTLREMIDRDQRLLVLVENDGGSPGWYHEQEAVTEETPYTFRDLAALAAPAGCAPNRGGTGKPLMLMNNWIETTPAPRPTNARRANARAALLARIEQCRAIRGRLPTIVAVDFYRQGDLLGVVRQLNERRAR